MVSIHFVAFISTLCLIEGRLWTEELHCLLSSLTVAPQLTYQGSDAASSARCKPRLISFCTLVGFKTNDKASCERQLVRGPLLQVSPASSECRCSNAVFSLSVKQCTLQK